MCQKRHEGVEFEARDGTESCTVEEVHSWDPSNPCSQGKTDAKTMMMMMMLTSVRGYGRKTCLKNHECKSIIFHYHQILSPMKERGLKPEMTQDHDKRKECIHGICPTPASRKKRMLRR